MPLFFRTLIQQIVGYRRRMSHRRGRWSEDTLVWPLRVTQLEDRRVLNADAAPVQQLLIAAGAAANDGHADTFHIEQLDSQLHISLNGQEVSRTAIDKSESITIRGSSDDDTFIVDLHGAKLSDFNLRIDGGEGGHDVLKLLSDHPVDLVAHEMQLANQGKISVESSGQNSSIAYHNIATVEDNLSASSRTFNSSTGGQSIAVDDVGTKDDGFSQLVAKFSAASAIDRSTSVIFKNPLESLTVSTHADGNGIDTVDLHGLDKDFAGSLQVTGSYQDAFSVSGRADLGALKVATGSISIFGEISAQGGVVDLRASDFIHFDSSAAIHDDVGSVTFAAPHIQVDGQIVSHGGNVKIDSGPTGESVVRGVVDVSQHEPANPLGSIQILGAKVALDSARIDATGIADGGVVFVGGDFQGKNSAVRNATQAWVSADTVISVDAGMKGSGGRVIVWANESTQFFGRITARGGQIGGNGGFVEVSQRPEPSLPRHGRPLGGSRRNWDSVTRSYDDHNHGR